MPNFLDMVTFSDHEKFVEYTDPGNVNMDRLVCMEPKIRKMIIYGTCAQKDDDTWRYIVSLWCAILRSMYNGNNLQTSPSDTFLSRRDVDDDNLSDTDMVVLEMKEKLRNTGCLDKSDILSLAYIVAQRNDSKNYDVYGVIMLNETNKILSRYTYTRIDKIHKTCADRLRKLIILYSKRTSYEKYVDTHYWVRQMMYIRPDYHAALGGMHPCDMTVFYEDKGLLVRYANEKMVKSSSQQIAEMDWGKINLDSMGLASYILAEHLDNGNPGCCVNGDLVKHISDATPKLYVFSRYCNHPDHYGLFDNGYYIPNEDETDPLCAVILEWIKRTPGQGRLYKAITDCVDGNEYYNSLILQP